jgi:3-hydroxybutyryl-CoA dehydratase
MTENTPLAARRGLYFEEFAVGQSVTSMGRSIGEADVMSFAAFTGDWTPIHTDAQYAASHPFGQRVAHGMLGLSIASALAVRLGFLEETILAFREIRDWKFSQPIYLNDTIRARVTVSETKPVRRMQGGLVSLAVEVINQHEVIVQHGTWVVLVKSQETTGPGAQSGG